MRSIYTYDIQFIAFFINTYNMCMQVVECCGKIHTCRLPFHTCGVCILFRRFSGGLYFVPASGRLCGNRIIPRVSGAISRV